RAKESIKRDLTLRNEKLTQVNHTLNQVKVMSERDEKALNSIRQRETDIKERHQELKQLNKQIEDTERDNTLLRKDIGWDEEYLSVYKSEVMITHRSELNRIKDGNIAQRDQIKRAMKHQEIEQERYNHSIERLHSGLFSDENYEQKKVDYQRALELGEKR